MGTRRDQSAIIRQQNRDEKREEIKQAIATAQALRDRNGIVPFYRVNDITWMMPTVRYIQLPDTAILFYAVAMLLGNKQRSNVERFYNRDPLRFQAAYKASVFLEQIEYILRGHHPDKKKMCRMAMGVLQGGSPEEIIEMTRQMFPKTGAYFMRFLPMNDKHELDINDFKNIVNRKFDCDNSGAQIMNTESLQEMLAAMAVAELFGIKVRCMELADPTGDNEIAKYINQVVRLMNTAMAVAYSCLKPTLNYTDEINENIRLCENSLTTIFGARCISGIWNLHNRLFDLPHDPGIFTPHDMLDHLGDVYQINTRECVNNGEWDKNDLTQMLFALQQWDESLYERLKSGKLNQSDRYVVWWIGVVIMLMKWLRSGWDDLENKDVQMQKRTIDLSKYVQKNKYEEEKNRNIELQRQIDSLKAKLKRAQEYNDTLSNTMKKLEYKVAEHEDDRKELIRLRNDIYAMANAEAEEESPQPPETSAENKRKMNSKILVLGGHERFIKELRNLLPGPTYKHHGMAFTEKEIRNCDELWIVPRYISHSEYNKMISTARRYKRQVQYLTSLSVKQAAAKISIGDAQ